MRRSALLLMPLAMLAVPALPILAPSFTATAAQPANADAAFSALSAAYIDNVARLSPVYGTQLGDHRFDDKLPDISAAGRAAQVAFDRKMLADLAKIDIKALSRDNQVDALLLKNALEYDLWDIEVLKSWSWNAQSYNDVAGSALYTLAARDFAPWPQRLKAATVRMEALPAFLLESRKQLIAAKVPEIYATTVSRQNSGIVDIAESMLAPHAGELAAADKARFDTALTKLKSAVADQQSWLDKTLVPAAKGDFRLGTTLYDQKMRFALMSTMSRTELKAKAEKAATDART
jgi:uncharacterized protein (DUF885 family)